MQNYVKNSENSVKNLEILLNISRVFCKLVDLGSLMSASTSDPRHSANNVGLILSLSTGLTSPQFHVKYDSEFATVCRKNNEERPRSEWQDKCKFRTTQQVGTASRTRGRTVKRRKSTAMRTPTNKTMEPEPDTGDPFTNISDGMTIQESIEPEGDDDESEIIDTQQTEHGITEPTAVTENNP